MTTHVVPKKWIELLLAVVLPVCILGEVISEHSGLLDHWRGLDRIQDVADNFGLSYAPDASRPVYPADKAWQPLIQLIKKYSMVKLRTDKSPLTVARFQASLSTTDGRFEWTAPSTAIAVLYRHWPGDSGEGVPLDDFTVVGSIGDLQSWIVRSKNDFHFLFNDIVLGLITILLGVLLWRRNYSR